MNLYEYTSIQKNYYNVDKATFRDAEVRSAQTGNCRKTTLSLNL